MVTKKIALTKQEIFIKLAGDAKPYVFSSLAQNPEIDNEIQSILMKSESGYALRGLAMNPSVTKESIDGLVKIIETDAELGAFVIQGFFSNTKLPKHVVNLITSSDYSRSDFIAIKSKALSAPEKQVCLKRMIKKDAYAHLLQDAAACDALEEKQIEFLLTHEAENVRAELARNPIISEATQLILSKDKSAKVRDWLASNPVLSAKLEGPLSKDKEDDVKYSLIENLRSRMPKAANKNAKVNYVKALKNGDDKELIKLGLDPNTPPDVIEQLCAKYYPAYDNWVSVTLALNPKISMDRLSDISKSKNLEVLKALATNALVTLEILTALSKNKDYQVRGVVANPGSYEFPSFMLS
jgi:hypothetical protein